MILSERFVQLRAFMKDDGELIAVGLVLALAMLAFDFSEPLGVAGGLPYVVLVLLCLWAKHPACTYFLATVGTIFTIVGYFISPEGGEYWVVLTNRSLTILAIWAASLFSVIRMTELRKRQALDKRLSELLSLTADAIISVDRESRILVFNLGAENTFGYEAREVLGQPMEILLPEALRNVHREHMKGFARGSISRRPMGLRSELRGVRKDGSEFPAMASISKAEIEGRTLYTAILHDISDRKEALEQLQHAQKMETVGQLTGGIAHEFNNLLMVIFGSLEMIEDRLGEHDPLEEYTSRAMVSVRRGAKLTQGLLAFSRKQRLEAGSIDINGLIKGTASLMQRTLGETVKFETDLEENLWLVSADVGQIEAALLNFAINARDAMPAGGTITIRTSNRTVNGDVFHDNLGPGEYVMLEVIDTGGGMTPAVKKQAFEPFFTTKAVGKGTGLGLSSVYGFARQSGGHVEADSEVGKGTTLRLYLPRSAERPVDLPDDQLEAENSKDCSGIILVLEDDPEVRAMAVIQLTALGYDAIAADTGPEALKILEGGTHVDLLFADMVLPGGLSGPDTVHQALEKYPNLKALFASGYPEKDLIDLAVNGDDIPILRKPYPKSELARAVAAALNSN